MSHGFVMCGSHFCKPHHNCHIGISAHHKQKEASCKDHYPSASEICTGYHSVTQSHGCYCRTPRCAVDIGINRAIPTSHTIGLTSTSKLTKRPTTISKLTSTAEPTKAPVLTTLTSTAEPTKAPVLTTLTKRPTTISILTSTAEPRAPVLTTATPTSRKTEPTTHSTTVTPVPDTTDPITGASTTKPIISTIPSTANSIAPCEDLPGLNCKELQLLDSNYCSTTIAVHYCSKTCDLCSA